MPRYPPRDISKDRQPRGVQQNISDSPYDPLERAMPTATITRCAGCKTPVRPNKIRCDKCRSVRLDKLLDHHLLTTFTGGQSSDAAPALTAALALASRNTRNQQS